MRTGATILAPLLTALFLLSGEVRGQEVKPAAIDKSPTIVELSKVKAEPPRATDPITLDLGKSRFFKIEDYAGPLTWEITGDALLLKEVEKPTLIGMVQQGEVEPSYPEVPAGAVILWGKRPGTAELSAWGVVGGKPKKLLTKPFIVYGTEPTPKPIDPIVPKPIDPVVSTNPFGNATGLHVQIVYESEDNLPPAQANVIFGKKFRDYLDANCAPGPDGKTKAWQIWDKDVDASGAAKVWQDAFKRPRKSIPWIIIGNGKAGYEGALPADPDAAIKLIDQYRSK